ncbi:hypothetical protein F5Y18DRAFT_389528 [Xylariaceae sp. FL1019]|nr:hypothetical protein F5Y18DRAFT_389528 [Xylariaceae sp. FL1019]
MSSLAAIRSHLPAQHVDKFDKLANRLSPQPPPAKPSPCPNTQNNGSDYFNSNPTVPKSFELAPKGHTMVVAADDGEPFLTITFASSSLADKVPDLLVFRGTAAGEEIASAHFSKWMGKSEMHYNGQKTKLRGSFESSTGLGKAKWQKEGMRAMKFKLGKEVIAKFEAVGSEGKGKGKRNKGNGQFEIARDGLTREQTEEIIVSCLLERERMRLNGELLQDGVWEVFMASIGL